MNGILFCYYLLMCYTFICKFVIKNKGGRTMTFFEQEKPYRVTFDLEENIFIVYSTATGQQGTGITIEQAIYDLKKSA